MAETEHAHLGEAAGLATSNQFQQENPVTLWRFHSFLPNIGQEQLSLRAIRH